MDSSITISCLLQKILVCCFYSKQSFDQHITKLEKMIYYPQHASVYDCSIVACLSLKCNNSLRQFKTHLQAFNNIHDITPLRKPVCTSAASMESIEQSV